MPVSRIRDEERLMDSSEQACLERYRRGDRNALEALVEQYRRPLYGFILRMMEGRGDADDIFQETWARAIRNLPRFRTGNLLSWLFRIAHNLVIDEFRRKSRHGESTPSGNEGEPAIEHVPDPSRGPDKILAAKEIGETIRGLVAQLPREQREVFLMRTEGGLSFRDIARIQEVPLNTALGRMHYAVLRLRSALQEG